MIRTEDVHNASLVCREVDLRGRHEVLNLALHLTCSFFSFEGRRHGAFASVHFTRYGSAFRINWLLLHLLANHQNIHLGLRLRIIEIFDIVHNALLSHLVSGFCATYPTYFPLSTLRVVRFDWSQVTRNCLCASRAFAKKLKVLENPIEKERYLLLFQTDTPRQNFLFLWYAF